MTINHTDKPLLMNLNKHDTCCVFNVETIHTNKTVTKHSLILVLWLRLIGVALITVNL